MKTKRTTAAPKPGRKAIGAKAATERRLSPALVRHVARFADELVADLLGNDEERANRAAVRLLVLAVKDLDCPVEEAVDRVERRLARRQGQS